VTVQPQDSFQEYVRARLGALSRVAYLLTGDRHLAEDLVQSALVRTASHWERITAHGDPDAYVRRVLYTQSVSWRRRRRVPTVLFAVPPEPTAPDSVPDVTSALVVRQALARLAPRQRAVLVLCYFEDLTEAAAAEILGCSIGTIKSQRRDALARLRQHAPELADLVGAVGRPDRLDGGAKP
jgi:RNA polymerase sigma-70 factor (sigma-E family)